MTRAHATTQLAPGLLRVVAPNPSAYTADGTNTYVLGRGDACVVDPGPSDARHLDAILAALAGRPCLGIVVTHAHRDHSALAPALAARTGAPVLAYGDAAAGVRPGPAGLGGGEGVDRAFRPSRPLADGEAIAGDGWRLRALHTPGHMGNHLCLDAGDALFSGDHAMGFATTLVSPPEGDMGDYVASLRRLIALGPRRLLPGHGEPVADGQARLRDLLAHREAREAQVMAALGDGPATAAAVARHLYAGLAPGLMHAAERNVLAHLADLHRRGMAVADGPVAAAARFRRAPGFGPGRPPGALL